MTAPTSGPAPAPQPTGAQTTGPRLTGTSGGLWAIYRLQLRLLLTVGRVVVMVVLGAVAVIIGAVLGSSGRGTGTENATDLIGTYGFILLLPVASLVFASSALGDLREDATLVYLWLRPLRRWVAGVASWLAALTITLPCTVVPLALASMATGAPGAVTTATIEATLLGAVTYTAVFTALGLRARRALMWGLLYIFIWEGFVANASESAAQLAVLAYTQSVLQLGAPRADLHLAVVDAPMLWLVPLAVTVAAIGYTIRRLHVQEVP